MRERTTWNREQIAKLATGKTADDPSVLNNPDHLKQQPAADAYLIGGPSDFAEDVAAPNWKAEYSGGEVKRNEIGMPEMRGETFTHAEKTAAEQEEEDDFLQKKADVCINLARRMLPKTASESMIEDQSLAFMFMPNAALIETANRLAQQDEQDEEQQKQAQQQQDDKGQEQAQKQAQQQQSEKDEQQKQAQQQQAEKDEQAQKQAQQQQQSEKDEQKQAGQIPENFKKKDDEEGQQQQKQAQQQQDEQQKQAMGTLAQQACQSFQTGNMAAAQQAVQQMVQSMMLQHGQQQPQQAQQQQIQDAVMSMIQQAMGQQQQPQQAQQQDDQLLDQMLQQQGQQPQQVMASASAPTMDIELQGASMDTGEIHLGSEDEALATLFASNAEVRDATHAQSLQTGIPVQAGMTRTAATRTVGTRPNGGVAQLGGGTTEVGGGDIDRLSSLWQSAPDVRNVFDS